MEVPLIEISRIDCVLVQSYYSIPMVFSVQVVSPVIFYQVVWLVLKHITRKKFCDFCVLFESQKLAEAFKFSLLKLPTYLPLFLKVYLEPKTIFLAAFELAIVSCIGIYPEQTYARKSSLAKIALVNAALRISVVSYTLVLILVVESMVELNLAKIATFLMYSMLKSKPFLHQFPLVPALAIINSPCLLSCLTKVEFSLFFINQSLKNHF